MKFRISLIGCLVLWNISNAISAIVAFDAADARFKPQIIPNNPKATLVNIQAADENGVSRNIYSEFNIEKNQLVALNNSNQTTGNIAANPLLSNGTAKVILNEVNSNQASRIHGILYVMGDRADVIIANPAGIDLNGANFFNIARLTLAAGGAIFNPAGNHAGYVINGGQIKIAGRVNAGSSDINILSNSVELSGNLNAKSINMLLGNNEISSDLKSVKRLAETNTSRDGLTLSTGSSMYAENISIKSTNQGIAVNLNRGARIFLLTSNTEDRKLVIDADGIIKIASQASIAGSSMNLKASRLENAGGILAGEQLNVQARDAITNSGMIRAGAILFTTEGLFSNLTSRGSIDARQSLEIQAGDIFNEGKIRLANGVSELPRILRLTATQNQTGAKGQIINSGTISQSYRDRYPRTPLTSLTATTLQNSGNILGAQLNIMVSDRLTNSGNLSSSYAVNIQASDILNDTTGRIMSVEQLKLIAAAAPNSKAHSILHNKGYIGNIYTDSNAKFELSADAIYNQGDIMMSRGELILNATQQLKNDGEIRSNGQLKITAGDFLNSQGAMIYGRNGITVKAIQSLLNASTGSIVNKGSMHVIGDADDVKLALEGQSIANEGSILANRIEIVAKSLDVFSNTGTITESQAGRAGNGIFLVQNNSRNAADGSLVVPNKVK